MQYSFNQIVAVVVAAFHTPSVVSYQGLFQIPKVTVPRESSSEVGRTFAVPLERQNVPVRVKGRTVAHKTAYFGNVHVAHPTLQNFTVVFDTGSAHFLLPSSRCNDPSCLSHRRYDRSHSASAINIDHDGNLLVTDDQEPDQVAISYGTGKILGDFVDEVVCLGSPGSATVNISDLGAQCVRARLITATTMSSEPFSQFQFDGVLGLGLEALALHPEFNVLGQMTRRGRISPVFGVYLAHGDDHLSEIMFGGHNTDRVSEPFKWTSVANPEKGYWQVRIYSITIGDEKLDLCDVEGCVGIVDTGTSLLGIPKAAQQVIHLRLARRMPQGLPEDTDCRAVPGPNITISLGDVSVELEAADYTRPAAMQVRSEAKGNPEPICRASLLPVDMPQLGPKVFLLGEPVLRKYYTMYDSERQRIGFAPSVAPLASAPTVSSQMSTGALPRWSEQGSTVV